MRQATSPRIHRVSDSNGRSRWRRTAPNAHTRRCLQRISLTAGSTTSPPGCWRGEADTPSRMAVRKTRLDTLLVERGLVASRERARALILAGQVRVAGRPATKAGL